MLTVKRLTLNLASRPLRNRKLFYFLLSFLWILFLFISFLGGKIFLEYRNKSQEIRASIMQTSQLIEDTQREEGKTSDKIEDAIRKYKKKIDLLNSIILRKSFSWTELFSDLERSLPNSSYIVSLAPVLREDSTMVLRIKVATPGLEDLLKLINNLEALKFNQIRRISETKNKEGLLLSEISLNYERDI